MRSYFEGWYFKQHTNGKTVAVIPAIHADRQGKKNALIQLISNDCAEMAEYSPRDFHADRRRMEIQVGENVFSRQGIRLKIKSDALTAEGELSFGEFVPPRFDIMGPFSVVPFMECRHSLFSLRHSVEGSLYVNGEEIEFNPGVGYIEGDRGHSFPQRYVWTQCSFGERNSLMLSVADIPFLGWQFTGIIGFVLLDGHEYRIATYSGARVRSLNNKTLTVAQGDMLLSAELLDEKEQRLRAPVMGDMSRFIHENVSCRARYRFEKGGNTLFDFISEEAGFEHEWPTA